MVASSEHCLVVALAAELAMRLVDKLGLRKVDRKAGHSAGLSAALMVVCLEQHLDDLKGRLMAVHLVASRALKMAASLAARSAVLMVPQMAVSSEFRLASNLAACWVDSMEVGMVCSMVEWMAEK